MLRSLFAILVSTLLFAVTAFANGAPLTSVPRASVVGRGVLSFAFWEVYQATLYAPNGRYDPSAPFALSIEYYRSIDGADIAERSAVEMRAQGFKDESVLSTWIAEMKAIFPDVKDGTVLTAVFTPGKETVFYNGGKPIGTISGDDFGRRFFGIWLDERTTEPELRRALLGLS